MLAHGAAGPGRLQEHGHQVLLAGGHLLDFRQMPGHRRLLEDPAALRAMVQKINKANQPNAPDERTTEQRRKDALAEVAQGFGLQSEEIDRAIQRKEYPNYSGLMVRVMVAVMCLIAYQGLFGFVLKLSQVMSFAILSEEQWGLPPVIWPM